MELREHYSFILEGQKLHILMITHGTITAAVPRHSHSKNSYEIHYIYGGKGILAVQDTRYPLSPGTLFVTGPGVEHAQYPDTADPMQEDCLYFYLEEPDIPNKNSHITNTLRSHPFWYGRDSQNMARTIRMIHEELAQTKLGHTLSITACFQHYLVLLARNMSSALPGKTKEIGPVQLKIEEAFLYQYRDLTLDDVCAITGMCRRQTQRLLEEYYGYGFQKKRTASRMSAAASFLASGEYTVDEIADLTGYSSLSSFLQAFKGYYHMTVKEYRESVGMDACKTRQASRKLS